MLRAIIYPQKPKVLQQRLICVDMVGFWRSAYQEKFQGLLFLFSSANNGPNPSTGPGASALPRPYVNPARVLKYPGSPQRCLQHVQERKLLYLRIFPICLLLGIRMLSFVFCVDGGVLCFLGLYIGRAGGTAVESKGLCSLSGSGHSDVICCLSCLWSMHFFVNCGRDGGGTAK